MSGPTCTSRRTQAASNCRSVVDIVTAASLKDVADAEMLLDQLNAFIIKKQAKLHYERVTDTALLTRVVVGLTPTTLVLRVIRRLVATASQSVAPAYSKLARDRNNGGSSVSLHGFPSNGCQRAAYCATPETVRSRLPPALPPPPLAKCRLDAEYSFYRYFNLCFSSSFCFLPNFV